jgi:hypothetical protein
MTLHVLLTRATLVALILAFGAGDSVAAKKKSDTTVRDRMTSEQKAKLRKQAYAYCSKKFGRVHHIEIKANGRVTCWTYPGGM